MSTPFLVPDPLPVKSAPTPPPPGRPTVEGTYWRPGEALPVQVTATMWIEAKGHCPDVAIAGLRRQVEHWREVEGWELADGAVSIDHWPEDVDYQASVRLIRSVKW